MSPDPDRRQTMTQQDVEHCIDHASSTYEYSPAAQVQPDQPHTPAMLRPLRRMQNTAAMHSSVPGTANARTHARTLSAGRPGHITAHLPDLFHSLKPPFRTPDVAVSAGVQLVSGHKRPVHRDKRFRTGSPNFRRAGTPISSRGAVRSVLSAGSLAVGAKPGQQ